MKAKCGAWRILVAVVSAQLQHPETEKQQLTGAEQPRPPIPGISQVTEGKTTLIIFAGQDGLRDVETRADRPIVRRVRMIRFSPVVRA